VTLGTVLQQTINYVLGNKTEQNGDEEYQNDFMIPLIILVNAFKKK